MDPHRPDPWTLAAFCSVVLLGGMNALAVRFTNFELPPAWGAAARFALAGAVFAAAMLALRRPWPRGAALTGAVLFGVLTFGLGYALVYWALVHVKAEFLAGRATESGSAPMPASSNGGNGRKVLLHGHCHQKAAIGTRAAVTVLEAAGFEVDEVDSGCCGMAGSFGFEREHYDLSMAIGERRLLPAVRRTSPETQIVAMGVSCRQQIVHATGRNPKHLVQILSEGL